jgi:phage terminase large subunit
VKDTQPVKMLDAGWHIECDDPDEEETSLKLQVPRVFAPLLVPARYKGLRGGRSSGKSHFCAERILEKALRKYHLTDGREGLRWACLREVQKSLQQSSLQLLKDKIAKYDLGHLFDSKRDHIVTPGRDGVISFQGMQNHTADSVKSMEGYDGAWVEEAQKLSEYSLSLLRPTFRKDSDPRTGFEGSEIWFSYNTDSPKDPVENFLFGGRKVGPNPVDPRVLNTVVDDAIVIEANWYDNPYLPDVMYKEMIRDKKRDPDRYAHVWMGKYRKLSQARVFRNWRVEDFETPRNARFYFGADWGYSVDPTVLIRSFLDESNRRLFIDWEAYRVGCEIDNTPALFETIPGARDWPIRADSARPETISYMKRHGFNIQSALKGAGSVEDGIEFLKSYEIIVHSRCVHTSDELSYYSWKIDKRTEEVLPILEDKKNHVIDSVRYALEEYRRRYNMMDVLE